MVRFSALGRSVPLVLAVVTLATPARAEPNAREAADRALPNVVFVLTDDQRWDTLGCMGNGIVRTPNIDRMAAGGILFSNMFCTTSICAVSRASLMTGQYARRHQIQDFSTPLSPEQLAETFPPLLRRQGYRTGMVGKWGLGGPMPVEAYDEFRGFAGQGRYFEPGAAATGEHLTHRLGAQALEFLDGCEPGKPFLLQFYTKAAHCQDGDPWPFQPDPRYADLFADVTIPPPKTATGAHFQAIPEFLRESEARQRWHVRFETPELYQKSVKDYYRLIAGIDDVVGNIMAKLQERRLADNTVIIFTSDNGFFLGEHGLAGKWFMHEESIRLPLVIYDPRLPESLRGRTRSEMVLSIDVAPTILALAGVPIPSRVQGRSLVPLINGANVPWRDAFFYEHMFGHERIPQSEGVRTNEWKYVRYVNREPLYEELYDLRVDPLEEHNLAGDSHHAETLERLRARWRQMRKQVQ